MPNSRKAGQQLIGAWFSEELITLMDEHRKTGQDKLIPRGAYMRQAVIDKLETGGAVVIAKDVDRVDLLDVIIKSRLGSLSTDELAYLTKLPKQIRDIATPQLIRELILALRKSKVSEPQSTDPS